MDDSRYDMTIPKPGEFDSFMWNKFPDFLNREFSLADMKEAFEAGWEAAVLEHC